VTDSASSYSSFWSQLGLAVGFRWGRGLDSWVFFWHVCACLASNRWSFILGLKCSRASWWWIAPPGEKERPQIAASAQCAARWLPTTQREREGGRFFEAREPVPCSSSGEESAGHLFTENGPGGWQTSDPQGARNLYQPVVWAWRRRPLPSMVAVDRRGSRRSISPGSTTSSMLQAIIETEANRPITV